MKKRNLIAALIGCVLVLTLAIGATMAYLITNSNTINNVFTIGGFGGDGEDSDILLTEPSWINAAQPDSNENGRPEKAENMVPGVTVAKDPTVTNKSDELDAYIFLQVDMPYVEADSSELFTVNGIGDGWELVESNIDGDIKTYIYAWTGTGSNMQVLAKGTNSTDPLFESVTLKDLDNLPSGQQTITVKAYAIQTTLVNESGTEITPTPANVWALIKDQLKL